MEVSIKQRSWIMLGLGCMTFLVSADMMAVNLVLPSLAEFHLSLLKNHVFMLANLVRLIVSYVMFSLLFVAVLYLDTVFHYEPMATSSLFFIVAVAMITSAIAFGQLSKAWGPYNPLILASLILVVFFAYCSFHTESFGVMEFVLYFCAGLAFGVMRPGITHIVLRSVPENEIGVSNAISSMVLPIGGMIGVALSGWLLSSESAPILSSLLQAPGPPHYKMDKFV